MIVKTTIIKGMDNFFSDENSIGRSNISHSKIKATTSPKISENKKGGALKKNCARSVITYTHTTRIKNKTAHRSKAVHSNHSYFFKKDTGCHEMRLKKCNPFKLIVPKSAATIAVTNKCILIKTPLFCFSIAVCKKTIRIDSAFPQNLVQYESETLLRKD